jgi:cell division protein FtsW (lipid II flippase)
MEEIQNQNQQPMSVKDWVITLLIMAIPVVGFIMLFVYAFSSSENINKQNWAKAQLLVAAIVLGIVMLLFMIFGVFFASSFAGMQHY